MTTLTTDLQDIINQDEQYHLQYYMLSGREDNDDYRLFDAPEQVQITPDQFTFEHIEGVDLLVSTWYPGRGSSFPLEYFIKGACALSRFVNADDWYVVNEFVSQTLDEMETRIAHGSYQVYPAIVDAYLPFYEEAASAVLNNEEPSNRDFILAYIVGVFWLLGHIKGIDDCVVEDSGETFLAVHWIKNVLVERAQLAILE